MLASMVTLLLTISICTAAEGGMPDMGGADAGASSGAGPKIEEVD